MKIFISHTEEYKKKLDNIIDIIINLRRNNKDVIISISESKPQRNLKQNAYYWGIIVEPLANHFGYTRDEMHEILLDQFSELKEVINPFTGEIQMKPVRSKEMTEPQIANYFMKIRIFMETEYNFIIP